MVYSHLGNVGQFLKMLNIKLSYDLAIPVLHVYPKKENICGHKTGISLSLTAWFIIAKQETQPERPSSWNEHTGGDVPT